MKYIRLILPILFLVSCTNDVKRTPRIKKEPERVYGGKVKQIVEYDCERYWSNETPLKIDKTSCKVNQVKEFNTNEIVIREMNWYDSNYPGEPDFIESVTLDENGLVVEEVAKMDDGVIKFNNRTNYSYNSDGFRTETVEYRDGNLSSRNVVKYDEYNCPVKELYYDENNNLKYYYKNEFDNRNREIASYKYDNNDELKKKWVKEYQGDEDNWVVKYVYNENGVLVETDDKREAYKTNHVDFLYSSGLPDEEFTDVQYYEDGKVKSWHFINELKHDIVQTYDKDGNLIRREIHNNGEWLETYTWKYREDGAVTEKSKSTSKIIGKTYYKKTTHYRLDSNGNWFERYTKDNEGNILYLAIREIKYYN